MMCGDIVYVKNGVVVSIVKKEDYDDSPSHLT